MQYSELISKTAFSFLRGASHPGELIQKAAELKLHAIAITDLHGVYALPKAYREAQKHPALKLISGAEIRFEDHPPIHLLAKNREGYALLCRILTAAHANRPKGQAALFWSEFVEFLKDPRSSSLFFLPRFHLSEIDSFRGSDLLEYLPRQNISIPVVRWLDGFDEERKEYAQRLSKKFELSIVASNDVHYHETNRRKLHDVMTAIRLGKAIDQSKKELFSNAESTLKSGIQMARLFRKNPEWINRSVEISDACSFSLSELRYTYPSEWIPLGETPQTYLQSLVTKGALRRFPAGIPADIKRQIDYELKLINQMKFADYFLTIWEIVEFARSKGILCQGRGSAANSVICYVLGITSIDPVRMNLLFERFISVERGEPPDIDVDFEHERREEVLQHVYQKYGRDRAGMVSAIITYRSRLSLRETRKALGILPPDLKSEEKAAYLETSYAAIGSRQAPQAQPSSIHSREKIAQELADELYGFPRHLSIHSGGFTLSAQPIVETVPIEPARMEGRSIVQWDKEDLDIVGLLKVDLLSLGMLTAVRKTLELTPHLTLASIPPEDRATYEMIQKADTVGTFQIESRAQMSMLPRLLPRTFYDLVIQVAIVRPGPIQGGMVHPFLRRRRGEEPIDMPHPALEPILRKTLGVPLFQEQVMKMAMVLGDFTAGEADHLRRAIAAWRSNGEIDRMGKLLMERLLAKGLPQSFVDRIFKQIHGFADYGFPESHAASFALIAYASCYLKRHYPTEFLCGLINSQPLGFYSNHTLVEDAKRHGVKVWPVHPQLSGWDCHLENGGLRLGFRIVRGMSESSAKEMIRIRGQKPFENLDDLLSRVKLHPQVLEALSLSDAFECFGHSPRDALWKVLSFSKSFIREATGIHPQLSLFSAHPEAWNSISQEETTSFAALSPPEAMKADYSTYGLSTRGHPMKILRAQATSLPSANARSLRTSGRNGQITSVAGLIIVRQRPPTAKGTCFATLEDEHGFVDLVLFPGVFEKFEDLFWQHSFFVVKGKLQLDGHALSLIVQSLQPLFQGLEGPPSKF